MVVAGRRTESVDARGASTEADGGRSREEDARGVAVVDVGRPGVMVFVLTTAAVEGGGVKLSRSSRKARASSFLDLALLVFLDDIGVVYG